MIRKNFEACKISKKLLSNSFFYQILICHLENLCSNQFFVKKRNKSTSANSAHGPSGSCRSKHPLKRKVTKNQSKKKHFVPNDVSSDIKMLKYRIEVGRDDGITAANIVGAIANEAGIQSHYIGQIKLQKNFSTVHLPEGMPRQLFTHLRKVKIRQKELKISLINS